MVAVSSRGIKLFVNDVSKETDNNSTAYRFGVLTWLTSLAYDRKYSINVPRNEKAERTPPEQVITDN
jgi:hypothetical protein